MLAVDQASKHARARKDAGLMNSSSRRRRGALVMHSN